jgi:hypothetical protein
VSSGTGTRYLPNKIRSVTNDNLLALWSVKRQPSQYQTS